MSDVVEFLKARLDEDEAAAKAAGWEHPCPPCRSGQWQCVGVRHLRYDNGAGEDVRVIDTTGGPAMWHEQISVRADNGGVADHIARHDPARVLREVAAKRKVLDEHQCTTERRDTPRFDPSSGERYPDEHDVICNVCGWATDRAGSACLTIRFLAAVYSDHPDYDPEWAPLAAE